MFECLRCKVRIGNNAFHAKEQACTAHLFNYLRMPFGNGFHLCVQQFAHLDHVGHETGLEHDVEHRIRHRRRQRVAAERASMGARRDPLRGLRRGKACPDGETAAKTLGR